MAIYHIVLFKLRPQTPQSKIDSMITAARAMVGQIPGLQRIDLNPPHPVSATRAQGFDMGLVAVLDSAETIGVYAGHEAHQAVHKLREEICTETLAYDLEFTP